MKLASFNPERDLETVQSWLSNPDFKRWFPLEPLKELPHETIMIFSNTGKAVGWFDVFNIDQYNQKAEIGIGFPEKRRASLVYPASKKVLKYVFEDLKLQRLTARVFSFNQACVRLLEHFGFVREGLERQAGLILGESQFSDILIYGLLKTDYEGGK